MTWECLNCGNFNDDAAEDECLKCDLDKVTAQNMVVKKKKSQCPGMSIRVHVGMQRVVLCEKKTI